MPKLAKYAELYEIWKSDSFKLRMSPHSTIDFEGWKQELTLDNVQSFYEMITDFLAREVQDRGQGDYPPFMRIEMAEFESTLFLGSRTGSEHSNRTFLTHHKIYEKSQDTNDFDLFPYSPPEPYSGNWLSTCRNINTKKLDRIFFTLCWRALAQVLHDGMFELDNFETSVVPSIKLRYYGPKIKKR